MDVEANINNFGNKVWSVAAENQVDPTAYNDISNYETLLDINTTLKGPKVNEQITAVAYKLQLQRISTEQCKAKI